MSRWLVALAVACFVALGVERADAQVFKPRSGAPAKGTPTKTAAAEKPAASDKPDKPADKPKAVAAAKKKPAGKRPAKKHKKPDDDDDTVTVEDDDVKATDD